jgi:hypothetical protein
MEGRGNYNGIVSLSLVKQLYVSQMFTSICRAIVFGGAMNLNSELVDGSLPANIWSTPTAGMVLPTSSAAFLIFRSRDCLFLFSTITTFEARVSPFLFRLALPFGVLYQAFW